MELSGFSDEDLLALRDGKLQSMSTDGLMRLRSLTTPVDASITDANDARAKSPAISAIDILRAKDRASPITRFLEGGWQPTLGLAQTAVHLASPVIGNKPAQFVDSMIADRRQQERRNDVLAGNDPNGLDVAGSLGAAINMAGMVPVKTAVGAAGPALPRPIMTGAETLLGRMRQGAALGPVSAAMMPVESGDYGAEKTAQTVISTALGGLAPPVAEGIIGAGGSAYNWLRNILNRPQAQQTAPQAASASSSFSGQLSGRGSGGGSTFGSVGEDPSAGLTPTQNWLANWWREQGGRMTPGQMSGSRSMQQMEAKLESQPMTSGTFNAIKDTNQKTLNRIAAREFGVTSDSLGVDKLQTIQERLSSTFRRVATKAEHPVDQNATVDAIAAIEREFEGQLDSPLANNTTVKRLLSLIASGKATNAQLHDIQSTLGKASFGQMTSQNGSRPLGLALGDVQDVVLEMMGKNLPAEEAAAFSAARQQYRTLMQLTGRTGVINPSTGNVSGASLANLLQQKDRFGYLFGNNNSDLYNAARFAQAFKPIVGDSGTATRSMITSPTDWVLSLPFNAATSVYTSNPSISMLNSAARANSTGFGSSGLIGDLTSETPLLGLLGSVAIPQINERRPYQ